MRASPNTTRSASSNCRAFDVDAAASLGAQSGQKSGSSSSTQLPARHFRPAAHSSFRQRSPSSGSASQTFTTRRSMQALPGPPDNPPRACVNVVAGLNVCVDDDLDGVGICTALPGPKTPQVSPGWTASTAAQNPSLQDRMRPRSRQASTQASPATKVANQLALALALALALVFAVAVARRQRPQTREADHSDPQPGTQRHRDLRRAHGAHGDRRRCARGRATRRRLKSS